MSEEVKLFGVWGSPYSKRIELALKLKGIEYEYIEEDLSNKSPLLLKYNPIHNKIPVLVHNGNPIAESLVILEYIDETWKNCPLLPEDPYQRAMARFWANVIDVKISSAGKNAGTKEGEEREKAIEEFYSSMKMLEKELEGKDFFGGDSIGYLDVVAMIIAFWYPRLQIALGIGMLTEEAYPLLFKWIAKFSQNDVVNECVPPMEKHVAAMKARMQKGKTET